MQHVETDTIVFAERMLALLDRGKKTATYKYALLLALMDVVRERTYRGRPPDFVTTRQLAEKTIGFYWRQTNIYPGAGEDGRLRQVNTGNALMLQAIVEYRSQNLIGEAAPLHAVKTVDKDGYERLLRMVEWNLIKNPLPRLQKVGNIKTEFIYTIAWDEQIENQKKSITEYQKGNTSNFDNRVLLKPGVGEHLLRLDALLRPLIQRGWTRLVADLNAQPESKLEDFLFSQPRTMVSGLREPLLELQDGYCFYCHHKIRDQPEVDHFIPWSRQPNDGLANLVLAHKKCNGYKRDFLAASDHVHQWLGRLDPAGQKDDLEQIAREHQWDLGLESSFGVASSIYLLLRPEMVLWRKDDDFELVEEATVERFRRLFSCESVA